MRITDLSKLAWMAFYVENEQLAADGFTCDVSKLQQRGYPQIPVTVPGNFYRDLCSAGVIEEPYFDKNCWQDQAQYKHLFYYTRFDYSGKPQKPLLSFEGIDTAADIFLNGQPVGSAGNMFVKHQFNVSGCIHRGENQLVVHIKPVLLEARKQPFAINDSAQRYNYASLHMRKSAHSFGWDIAPRLLAGGIWRPVYLEEARQESFTQFYGYTTKLDLQSDTAQLCFAFEVAVAADDISRYAIQVSGHCGESSFETVHRLWHTCGKINLELRQPCLWYPKNYGQPHLYRLCATLLKDGRAVDTHCCQMGVRTVELLRSSTTDEHAGGRFCFTVNGQRIFCMGTNWLPADALHANDPARIARLLPMLSELGCNMIRVWGGGVYEDDLVYDYCDREGILIWQDFMMGCAVYPQDEAFAGEIEAEATAVVKRLRQHPSIAVWAGDNENDIAAMGWYDIRRDPNENLLTRRVIAQVLRLHDFTRPYLPSSPYVDEVLYQTKYDYAPEDHLWGPRDYFKGEYYSGSLCHFASETGYHGCPAPASLERFIAGDSLWTAQSSVNWQGIENESWICHGTSMEADPDAPYSYRIRLMADQVSTLFGATVPCTLADFAKASQISQAEADKYFIERFRIAKWQKTGILWWNLADCWPQISDAVVDYYFTKKLAYHYIKRSQRPLCMIADERGGTVCVYAVSDLQEDVPVRYTLTDHATGEVLSSGREVFAANTSKKLLELPREQARRWLVMQWSYGGKTHTNHFVSPIKQIDYRAYLAFIQALGYDEFEGF